MNIALVILHADPARGGAERYTFDLAAALAGAGHRVSILASTAGGGPPGVQMHLFGQRGATRLRRYLRFLRELDRHLDANPYHIVHAMLPVRRCNVYHPHAGIAEEAVEGAHRFHHGLKRHLTRLGNRLNARRKRFARVERALLTQATPPAVLCLSRAMQAAVKCRYGLADDRLPILFNAVDLQRFDPGTVAPAAMPPGVNALMIAQDFERKGLAPAIRAIAALAPADRPNLLVVGKPDPGRYRVLARQLGIESCVHFIGPVADPRPYYRAADFFLLPTRHDPCSLVVLEALAMGLPVISTAQNGACEIMQAGVHGYVLEAPDDIPALTRSIHQLLDPARRSSMREACLSLRPRLSYEAHLAQLMAIYDARA